MWAAVLGALGWVCRGCFVAAVLGVLMVGSWLWILGYVLSSSCGLILGGVLLVVCGFATLFWLYGCCFYLRIFSFGI